MKFQKVFFSQLLLFSFCSLVCFRREQISATDTHNTHKCYTCRINMQFSSSGHHSQIYRVLQLYFLLYLAKYNVLQTLRILTKMLHILVTIL